MKLDKFVADVKEKITVKNDLLDKKAELLKRINDGKDFFLKATTNPVTPQKLADATKLMSNLAIQLVDIEAKIVDTDIILVTMLEAYCSDFVMKCAASQKINDAGDNIDAKSFVFVPYKDNGDYVEITPDELWFLKIIKSAIGIRNIEVISKDQYYNTQP